MKTALLVLLIPVVCFTDDYFMYLRPRLIEVGDTKFFEVECSFRSTNTTVFSKLTSLSIKQLFFEDFQAWVIRASVNESNHVTQNTVSAAGRINHTGWSSIRFSVHNPTTIFAGKYLCEAKGEMGDGSTDVLNKSGIVTAEKPTVSKMLGYYKEHDEDVLSRIMYARTVADYGDERPRCCRAVQNSKHHVYRSSEARVGKRYYLSPQTNILVLKEAEIQCRVLGGYLAEVDSEDELNFIRTFMEPLTDYDGIFIAGSDERSEGRWISAYRNTTVYLSWGSDQPNEGRSANCLCLWRDKDWRMADYQCDLDELVHKMGYLCEVEE